MSVALLWKITVANGRTTNKGIGSNLVFWTPIVALYANFLDIAVGYALPADTSNSIAVDAHTLCVTFVLC